MSTAAERRAERRRVRRAARSELKNTAYEIFIGVLSILSIVNLVLVIFLQQDPSLQIVLQLMNGLFSVIFLGDFVYRISTAPSAFRYFFPGFGWADLLASLPFPQLKILRLFRVLRVVRLMRQLGLRTVWNTLVHDRANSALLTLLLMGVLVMQWGSLAVLAVEEGDEGANITSASDALWYTMVTISTVGYGDQYPVTLAGRLIGALIIIVGVGIFGTFTGYLANVFLGPSKRAETDPDASDADADEDAEVAGSEAPAAADAERADAHAERRTAAARGVAAGAAAGAVATGVDASADASGPASTADAAPEALPARAGGDISNEAEAVARLEELLAQSERTMAEIRELLAGRRG